jgi:hypothetical protein
MGGLVGAVYDMWNGDPARTQESQLGALGGFETGTGEGLTTAGAKFDESILSGDPTSFATALAPEVSTGQQQVQQAANQGAQFGPRSGGTAASTANAKTAERGNIINLEGGLQSGAASSALSAGGNLLSQASGNIDSEANMLTARRAKDVNSVGTIGKSIAEMATGFAGLAPAPETGAVDMPTGGGGGSGFEWAGQSDPSQDFSLADTGGGYGSNPGITPFY